MSERFFNQGELGFIGVFEQGRYRLSAQLVVFRKEFERGLRSIQLAAESIVVDHVFCAFRQRGGLACDRVCGLVVSHDEGFAASSLHCIIAQSLNEGCGFIIRCRQGFVQRFNACISLAD